MHFERLTCSAKSCKMLIEEHHSRKSPDECKKRNYFPIRKQKQETMKGDCRAGQQQASVEIVRRVIMCAHKYVFAVNKSRRRAITHTIARACTTKSAELSRLSRLHAKIFEFGRKTKRKPGGEQSSRLTARRQCKAGVSRVATLLSLFSNYFSLVSFSSTHAPRLRLRLMNINGSLAVALHKSAKCFPIARECRRANMNMIALEERTQLFNLIFSVYSFNRFFIVLHHALISRTMFGFYERLQRKHFARKSAQLQRRTIGART